MYSELNHKHYLLSLQCAVAGRSRGHAGFERQLGVRLPAPTIEEEKRESKEGTLTMAIPFFLPGDDNDEGTRAEEQLMLQLYVTLHNALRSRNAHHPSRNRELYEFLRFMHLSVSFYLGIYTYRKFSR